MELGEGSSSSSRIRKPVECSCRLPAKIYTAWTDKNPGRRFYGCPLYKRNGECGFFLWLDKEAPFGWQKDALIQARNEIQEKKKVIAQLTKTIGDLRTELEEEKIINKFLKV